MQTILIKKSSKFLLLVLALGFISTTCHAQKNVGCSLIDERKPAQYINYKNTYSNVWLVFHNNTDCKIIVEIDDVESRTFSSLNHKDRPLRVHYLIYDRKKQTTKAGYGWGDSVGTYDIDKGESFTFIIPISDFKKHDIVVPFTYSWEKETVGAGFIGGVAYYVYFLSNDLPDKILRKSN